MKILIKYRTNCNNRLNLSICNLMKFIYITKPLPVFNKKFRENSGNPSSMFIYKKTGYKEKLRLLYSASKNQFLCKQTQRSSRVARFFYCKPNFRKQLGRMKILIKYRTNCNNCLNLSICNLMKFTYITPQHFVMLVTLL